MANMWSNNATTSFPAVVKIEQVKQEPSYNSSMLYLAINKELEHLTGKNLITPKRSDINNKHVSVVEEVNTFKPLYYSLKEKLKLHKVSPNVEHPFLCYLCERGFKEKRTLMNHENTHQRHKPYQCQSCKSNFNSNGELDRHTKYIHTRVKS